MKRNIILILFACLLSLTAVAQPPRGGHRGAHGPRPEFSFEQFQQEKCDFIVRELDLKADEQERFLPLYRQLLDAKSKLYHKYGGAHSIMRKVSKGEQVPDSIMQRASMQARQLKLEDAKLEQEYLPKFEQILSPVQVIKLQEAEQKFRGEMMKRAPRRPQ